MSAAPVEFRAAVMSHCVCCDPTCQRLWWALPGRAGAGRWRARGRTGGRRGAQLWEWSPAGRDPAAETAAPSPRTDTAWTSHLPEDTETHTGENSTHSVPGGSHTNTSLFQLSDDESSQFYFLKNISLAKLLLPRTGRNSLSQNRNSYFL